MVSNLCIGRSTITIVSFAPYSWFEQWTELAVKKRGDEYNMLKNTLGQQLIDQAVHIYPQLKVLIINVILFLILTDTID